MWYTDSTCYQRNHQAQSSLWLVKETPSSLAKSVLNIFIPILSELIPLIYFPCIHAPVFPLRPHDAKLEQHFRKLAQQILWKCVKKMLFLVNWGNFQPWNYHLSARTPLILWNFVQNWSNFKNLFKEGTLSCTNDKVKADKVLNLNVG